MKQYLFLTWPVLLSLAGCGSGSGGTSAFDAPGFANVTQKEFSFPSGAGVATVTNQPGPQDMEYNAAMILLDETIANKVADFLQLLVEYGPDIVVHSSSRSGAFYELDVSTVNANDELGNNFYQGMNLFSGGYVSYNFIEISGDYAFVSDGSVFSGNFPSALATYTGLALIDDRGGLFGSETADVTLSADFVSNKADLDIVGPNSFVLAPRLDIDQSQGRLHGGGSIGVNGLRAESATVLGYFAGKDAEGVHGVVFGGSDGVDALDAMFFGVR